MQRQELAGLAAFPVVAQQRTFIRAAAKRRPFLPLGFTTILLLPAWLPFCVGLSPRRGAMRRSRRNGSHRAAFPLPRKHIMSTAKSGSSITNHAVVSQEQW